MSETLLVSNPSTFPDFPDFEPPDVDFPYLPETAAGDLKLEELNLDVDFSVVDLFPIEKDECNFVAPSIIASNSSSDTNPNLIHGSPNSGNSASFGNGNLKFKRKVDSVNVSSNPSLSKSTKYNDVSSPCDTSNTSDGSERNDEDEKRKIRLMRNRESAQLSRQRKRNYVEELEEKLKILNSTAADLNGKLTFYMTENSRLANQLAKSNAGKSGGVKSKDNIPQANPMPPPQQFAWVPYIRFPMKTNWKNGYVPIPRLQTHTVTASGDKGGKGSSKRKKVASASFLGLFLVMLIFGGFMNFPNEVSGDKVHTVNKGRIYNVEGHASGSGSMNGSDREFSIVNDNDKNLSESMRALLYVPRNGRHVEINGNLIIHSGLASEKATMAQTKHKEKTKDLSGKEENGLTASSDHASAVALPKSVVEMCKRSKSCKISGEYQRALPSESHNGHRESVKSNWDDGPLRQWFREGLTGPILSSGTCSKVYQFEISSSTPIIPKTPSTNITNKPPPGKIIKNRRILYRKPIPLNRTSVHSITNSTHSSDNNESIPPSSMIVSILADPREAGDGDGDGMVKPKSLSRIFVVVLVDKVKYVTYSCKLPLNGQGALIL